MYTDEEKLELTDKVHLTKLARQLLRKEQLRLKKFGRKISTAKIACNLIIEKYGQM